MSGIVSRTLITLVRVSLYDDLLDDPERGTLSTQAGYSSAFATLGSELVLPWKPTVSPAKWSRFWSNYIGPGQLEKIQPERAWEYAVPFHGAVQTALTGPAGARGTLHACVFPTAVVVTASLELDGPTELSELADVVRDLARSGSWTAEGSTQPGSLEALMGQAETSMKARLTGAPLAPSATFTRSIVAPAAGTLGEDEADVAGAAAGPVVAGLARLAPPSTFEPGRLVDENASGDLQTRLYVGDDGHALWNAGLLQGQEPWSPDPIGCLVNSHADLIAQVEVCASVVRWAADRLSDGIAFSGPQLRLVVPAMTRLRALYDGVKDATKPKKQTYRSAIAKRRIEPDVAALQSVEAALGD